jgi:uncharacterized integral membrane protein
MGEKELEDKEAVKEERKISVPKFLIGLMKLITTAAFVVWLVTTIKLPWLMLKVTNLDPNLVFIGWISLGGLFVLHVSIGRMIDKAEMRANFDMKTDIGNILNALQRNR